MSIPLPALAVKTQQQSPIETYGQVLGIRSLLDQQRTRQLQQTGLEQENQQRALQMQAQQRQAKEGQAVREAFSRNAKAMPDKTYSDWMDATVKDLSAHPPASGISPETLSALTGHAQKARAETATATLEDLKVRDAQINNLRGAAHLVWDKPADTSPEQLETAFQRMRSQILQSPKAYPAETVAALQQMPHYPGKEAGDFFMQSIIGRSNQIKEDQEKLTAAKTAAETRLTTAEASVKELQARGGGGMPLGPDRVAQLNQALSSRYQVLNPGKPLPLQFALQPNATDKDFDRVDKVLESTEKGAATKAQQELVNEVRQQTAEIAREKQGAKLVRWTDPKTGSTVAGPMTMAKQAGAADITEVPTEENRAIYDARHVVKIIDKQGDEKAPEQMGILQLVEGLQKDGKLGVAASRINSFLAGSVGTSPGDDPRIITLLDKTALAMTLSMKAHFGASGGRSPQMLKHFMDMANATKMDATTLTAGIKAVRDYMSDRAEDPKLQAAAPQGAAPTGQSKATHRYNPATGQIEEIK